ncbi:MAG: fructosamine kinase family protein [Pseudomonadota bacterium]
MDAQDKSWTPKYPILFMSHQKWQTIASHISKTTGQAFQVQSEHTIAGGCINSTYHIEGNGQNYFVKLNNSENLDMFEAEAAGLTKLAQADAIKVPEPLCWGTASGHAYLVMEYIPFGGESSDLGQQLAAQHQTTYPQFGWYRDNYIGSTPQINTLENDWVTFWQKHRLGFQINLAAQQGYTRLHRKGQRLIAEVGQFFSNYQPQPSLLHGDLWSGNYAISKNGQPVIYDPAVYYGDRETDIAMTELFGGFPKRFYDAYQETSPLEQGYTTRKTLYNLYHILNHLNLFGGSYLRQAENMIASLLSELRY